MNPPIAEAITAAGGRPALAEALGVTEQAVHKWVQQEWFPPARAAQIEELFGVPRMGLVSPKFRAFVSGAST